MVDLHIAADVQHRAAFGQTYVSGIDSLAQRVLIELLTEKSSVLHERNRGTLFLQRCRKAKTEYDITIAFIAAKRDLRNNLSCAAITSPTEQFKSARLEAVTISEGALQISFTVMNRANQTTLVTTAPIKL